MKSKSDGKKGNALSEYSTGKTKVGLKNGPDVKADPPRRTKWDEPRKSAGKKK